MGPAALYLHSFFLPTFNQLIYSFPFFRLDGRERKKEKQEVRQHSPPRPLWESRPPQGPLSQPPWHGPQGCNQATKPPSFLTACLRWAVHHLAFRWARGGRAPQGQNRACGRMWLGAMFCLAHTDFYKVSKSWTCKNQDPLHIKLVRAKLIRGCAHLDRRCVPTIDHVHPLSTVASPGQEQHLEVVSSR